MKVALDTNILAELRQRYGDQAPALLFKALEHAHIHEAQDAALWGAMHLTPNYITDMIESLKTSSPVIDPIYILEFFNKTTGKKFRPIDSTVKMIRGLLKDYSVENIEFVIQNKSAQWKGDYELDKYLRPSTLFRRSNFENYLNEKPAFNVLEKNLSSELDALLGDK